MSRLLILFFRLFELGIVGFGFDFLLFEFRDLGGRIDAFQLQTARDGDAVIVGWHG